MLAPAASVRGPAVALVALPAFQMPASSPTASAHVLRRCSGLLPLRPRRRVTRRLASPSPAARRNGEPASESRLAGHRVRPLTPHPGSHLSSTGQTSGSVSPVAGTPGKGNILVRGSNFFGRYPNRLVNLCTKACRRIVIRYCLAGWRRSPFGRENAVLFYCTSVVGCGGQEP